MKLQHSKTDAGDAALLAEIARTGFCRPVAVTSEASQARRILIKARLHLVRQRRDTENAMRGFPGERIRDKIAASKKKGMWMGGFVPLGYDANDRTRTVSGGGHDAGHAANPRKRAANPDSSKEQKIFIYQ